MSPTISKALKYKDGSATKAYALGLQEKLNDAAVTRGDPHITDFDLNLLKNLWRRTKQNPAPQKQPPGHRQSPPVQRRRTASAQRRRSSRQLAGVKAKRSKGRNRFYSAHHR